MSLAILRDGSLSERRNERTYVYTTFYGRILYLSNLLANAKKMMPLLLFDEMLLWSCTDSSRRASLRKRSSRLRALNAVTAALAQHIGLPLSLQTDFNANPSPPLDVEEAQLLDQNDLNK